MKRPKVFKLKGYYTVEKYLTGRKLKADITPGLDTWLYTDKWPEENPNEKISHPSKD